MRNNAEPEQLPRNGAYFTKRDRNKARTIGIYTFKGRQTVRVGSTDTTDPEQAELALARFVLTNAEAMIRERQVGAQARDMHVKEVLNMYFIAHTQGMASRVSKIDELIARAVEAADAELIGILRLQRKSARVAQHSEEKTMQCVIRSVDTVWPGEGPLASQMIRPEQLHYVKTMRALGYSDSTIKTWKVRLFTAMKWANADGKLINVPERIRADQWMIESEEEVSVYSVEELAALFNAAAKKPRYWKYMNMAMLAPRPMTIIEATWRQVTLDGAPLIKLNPPGKRRTKKRRPKVAICPTLAAELQTWTRDSLLIVSHKGKGVTTHKLFDRLRKAAGVNHGSAMSLRRTIRTWLYRHNVPEAQADAYMGHADEGSATGRRHYKAERSEYMRECKEAIEALYSALRPLVTRPFAGGPALPAGVELDEQPVPGTAGEALLAALRVNSVSKTHATG